MHCMLLCSTVLYSNFCAIVRESGWLYLLPISKLQYSSINTCKFYTVATNKHIFWHNYVFTINTTDILVTNKYTEICHIKSSRCKLSHVMSMHAAYTFLASFVNHTHTWLHNYERNHGNTATKHIAMTVTVSL